MEQPLTVKGRAALTKLVDNLFAAKADMLKQAQRWSPKNPSWKWDGKTSFGALSDLYTEIKFGKKTTTFLEWISLYRTLAYSYIKLESVT